MSKEKQIEETAKDICHICSSYTLCEKEFKPCILAKREAEALYYADYRKQSEGRWEKRVFIIFDSEKVGFRCSECNTTWDTETHYCPNCGAKMKGGAE